MVPKLCWGMKVVLKGKFSEDFENSGFAINKIA